MRQSSWKKAAMALAFTCRRGSPIKIWPLLVVVPDMKFSSVLNVTWPRARLKVPPWPIEVLRNSPPIFKL